MKASKTRRKREDAPLLERPRVLLVEDEEDFRTLLCGWLSPRYDVTALPHGESLLEQAAARPPDLFILDVSLPGPDGFALCRRLRADPRFARTPIVFLTAVVSTKAFVRGLDAGGSAHLTKPVDRVTLLKRLEELLSQP